MRNEKLPPIQFDERIASVRLAPCGFLAYVDFDNETAVVVDLRTGKQPFEPAGGISFPYHGNFVVETTRKGTDLVIKVWDVHKGEWALSVIGSSMEFLTSLELDDEWRDDILIVNNSKEPDVDEAWDLRSLALIPRPAENKLQFPSLSFSRNRYSSGDHNRVAFIYENKTHISIEVWDRRLQRFVLQHQAPRDIEISLSPDGALLAVEAYTQGNSAKVLNMIEVDSGRCIWTAQYSKSNGSFMPPQFTSDGQAVAVYQGRLAHDAVAYYASQTGLEEVALPAPGKWLAYPYMTGDGLMRPTLRPFRANSFEMGAGNPPLGRWFDWLYRLLPDDPTRDWPRRLLLDIDARRLHHLGPTPPDFFGLYSPVREDFLCGDGRLSLQSNTLRDCIICWDLPLHGPWRWVLGIPASLGLLMALALWGGRRFLSRAAAT